MSEGGIGWDIVSVKQVLTDLQQIGSIYAVLTEDLNQNLPLYQNLSIVQELRFPLTLTSIPTVLLLPPAQIIRHSQVVVIISASGPFMHDTDLFRMIAYMFTNIGKCCPSPVYVVSVTLHFVRHDGNQDVSQA